MACTSAAYSILRDVPQASACSQQLHLWFSLRLSVLASAFSFVTLSFHLCEMTSKHHGGQVSSR
eukprot:1143476-Pelagomonas_calceolata.AAC.1